MAPPPIPPTFAATREALHRVAAHVLARRRFDRTTRIGLRVTPGGFATPTFGDDLERLRISGVHLLREVAGARATTTALDLADASLAEAAAFASVDLSRPFDGGRDIPEVGDVDAPLAIDADAAGVIAAWFDLGARVLDATIATSGPDADPTVVQLWPEHFDVAFDLRTDPVTRVNVGASCGDHHSELPYIYVGPETDARPGDASYWNQPFGAALDFEAIRRSDDPVGAARSFIDRGLGLLAG